MTADAPETPFRIDPGQMVDDAIAGFVTPDGYLAVAALGVRAVVAVKFSSWLLRRFGRRRAVAVTFALFAFSQVTARALTWIVRRAATTGNTSDWMKLPPWTALTNDERRVLVAAAAARLRP